MYINTYRDAHCSTELYYLSYLWRQPSYSIYIYVFKKAMPYTVLCTVEQDSKK